MSRRWALSLTIVIGIAIVVAFAMDQTKTVSVLNFSLRYAVPLILAAMVGIVVDDEDQPLVAHRHRARTTVVRAAHGASSSWATHARTRRARSSSERHCRKNARSVASADWGCPPRICATPKPYKARALVPSEASASWKRWAASP